MQDLPRNRDRGQARDEHSGESGVGVPGLRPEHRHPGGRSRPFAFFIACGQIACGQGGVTFPDGLVHDGEGLRDRQVVVHGRGEGRRDGTGGRLCLYRLAAADEEALNPAVSGGGLGERLRRVVDL